MNTGPGGSEIRLGFIRHFWCKPSATERVAFFHMDITRLTAGRQTEVFALLNRETGFTGFLRSDLQHAGLDSDQARVYGEPGQGPVESILVVYPHQAVYYALRPREIAGYLPILRQEGVSKLVGKTALMEAFAFHIPWVRRTDSWVQELASPPERLSSSEMEVRRLATRADAEQLYDLFMEVEEYGFTGHDRTLYVDTHVRIADEGTIRTYGGFVHGRLVSTAAYLNDRPSTAIVVGVATPPRWRRQGYATAVLQRLCQDALADGQVLYLFYTNPAAGSVYRKLGFGNGGPWTILTWDGGS